MKAEAGKSQDGEAEWIKVRVGGRKVNEGFLKETENEVCWFMCFVLAALIQNYSFDSRI